MNLNCKFIDQEKQNDLLFNTLIRANFRNQSVGKIRQLLLGKNSSLVFIKTLFSTLIILI